MESIWTTHENPLISNSLFFFFRKKDEERKKYRTTRVGGNVRSPGRVRSFRNFQSQREGARESWEVRSCAFFFFYLFTSNPNRYFAQRIHDIRSLNLSPQRNRRFQIGASISYREYRSDDRDREISDNRVSLVQR